MNWTKSLPRALPETVLADLDRFRRFCLRLKLEDGRPMVLEDWQLVALADYFAGVTETLILLPKKNGKTTLLAALVLFHLLTEPDPEAIVAASSREQAMILYEQAAGFVERTPGLSDRILIRRGSRVLRLRGRSGRARVLAADAETADGVIPTLAVVDELHRQKSADLYGVFRDGLGPRDGRMLAISTAGANEDSVLGYMRRTAHELPGMVYDPARRYRYARAVDDEGESFAFHEYALEPEDDRRDMAVVKLANPASWQTVKALTRRFKSPSMTPSQWARFGCGVWTEGEDPWIDPPTWDARAVRDLLIGPTEPCVLTVDLGVRHDSTAVGITAKRGERVVHETRIRSPKDGKALSLVDMAQLIRDLAGAYNVTAIGIDPWQLRHTADLLRDEGLPVEDFPQSPERMTHASELLYQLVNDGHFDHSGDPELRSHVLAGVTKETERGWRLVKDPRAKRPIDALIALAMGVSLVMEAPRKPARFLSF